MRIFSDTQKNEAQNDEDEANEDQYCVADDFTSQ